MSNPLRSVWNDGRAARNAWIGTADAHLVEVVAARGAVDAVTLDMQHGLWDRSTVADAVRAISLHGAAPLVRLPAVDEAVTGWVLDVGVAGVIAPLISEVAAAVDLVAACRYPPVGRRSFGPIRTALRPDDDPQAAADEAVVLAMIETGPALTAVDEIAAVPGLDGLFVGPADLGLALGIGAAQDREEPEIHDAFARVLAATRSHGGRAGVFGLTPTYGDARAADGFTLVTVWADLAAIAASIDATRPG